MKVYFFATIAAFFAISSAFSSECSIYVRQYDREMQCQGCGDDFYDRYDRRVADALGELGYSVTHDESEKTNFKLKREFTNVDWNKHKISVGIELTENHTARSWK